MKTKQKSTTRKKKGGAYGLVLNVGYNDKNDIIGVKTQPILANDDYYKKNHRYPKYSGDQPFASSMFENMMENLNDFFHPFDANNRNTKKKHLKLAINDTKHLNFIYLTNQIIKKLNLIKSPSLTRPFHIVRKSRRGEIEDTCKLRFINEYQKLLLAHANELNEEDDDIEAFDLDKSENKQERINTIRHLLKMPFLVNVISIKFGLLKNGDVTLKELYDIFRPKGFTKFSRSLKQTRETAMRDINQGMDELQRATRNVINYIKPSSMSYEQMVREENQELMKENEKMMKALKYKGIVVKEEPDEEEEEEEEEKEVQTNGRNLGSAPATTSSKSKWNPQSTTSNNSSAIAASIGSSTPRPQTGSLVTDPYNKFSDMLVQKYGIIKSTNTDPYLNIINDITHSIGIDINNLIPQNMFDIIKSKTVSDSICITMIRLFLSYDMRNFENFKKTLNAKLAKLDKVYEISYQQFIIYVEESLNSLSTWGAFRQKFTYDSILADMKSANNWEENIKTNLNKLYTLFLNFDKGYIEQMARMISKPRGLTEFYNENDTNPIF